MKLLIVDDQRSVHLYLQKALDLPALGFSEVFHAENGRQALEIIEARSPEVMLLDIQMPEMNGLQLLEALKRRGAPQPETIVLSAYDEFGYARRCIDFGVSRYVLKPIDPQELSEILSDAFHRITARRLDSYRWAFPLLCAHLDERLDLDALPIGHVDPLTYGVICLRARDGDHAALRAVEPISRCPVDGMVCLLVAVPSAEAWDVLAARLASELRADAVPAGLSRLHSAPREMADAAREAADALRRSFYAPKVRKPGEGSGFVPLAPNLSGDLRAIGDCFAQEDGARLAERVEHAFAAFARAQADPEDVLHACRALLARLRMEHCGEAAPRVNDWPEGEDVPSAEAVQDALIGELFALRQQIDPAGERSEAEILRRLRAYVDEHYGEDLSLTAMSARFYVSRYQISRLFKQMFKVNYQDYVLSVRMKAAAHMLAHTNARLYEISLAVGFDEPSYFSNVFKKAYGLSPRAYRLAEREKNP